MRRFQAGMDAGEPGIGFVAHRTPQLPVIDVAGRIAGQEVDVALEFRLVVARRVAGADRLFGRHYEVPVGVLDVDDAFGADDADLQAIHRAGPDMRQRPADVHAEDRAVIHGENAEGGIPGAPHRQRLVDRAGIDRHRRLALHQIHRHVERVGARHHHRRQVRPLVGLADGGDRHHAVHEGAGDYRGDVADLAADELALHRLKTAAKPVGVAHHCIGAGVLDCLQHFCGFFGVGRQRFFDEQVEFALAGRQQRADMRILVGGNDRRGDFGTFQQLVVVGGEKIGHGIGRKLLTDLGIGVAQPEPADPRIIARELGPDAPDGTAADDGKADWFARGSHVFVLLRSPHERSDMRERPSPLIAALMRATVAPKPACGISCRGPAPRRATGC